MTTADWEGLKGSTEHRTVGYRAWCFQDTEWCYPDALCRCCDQTTVPERWKGHYAGEVVRDLRAQVQRELDEARQQQGINGKEDGDDAQRLAYWMWAAEITAWETVQLMLDGIEVAEL